MRKIFFVILAALVAFTGMILPSGKAADEVNSKVILLNLQKSIDLALENNIDLKKQKIEVDKQKIASRKADDAADKASDSDSGSYSGLLTEKFTPKQKEMLVEIAERNYEMQQESLGINVKESYYNILLKQNILNVREGSLESAKQQYEIAQAKFKQGLIAEYDALVAEVQFKTKENDWETAQRELTKAKMDFKQLLNIDIDQEIALTDDFILDAKEVFLEDRVAVALESRLDMIQARETEELYALNVELTGSYYTSNTWTYKDASYQYEASKLDLEQQIAEVKLDVNKAYLDLQGAGEALEPAEKNVEQAKESLRIVNLRYESGLATSLEVLNAQNLLESTEQSYANAVFNYTMSVENFDFAVNHGSPR